MKSMHPNGISGRPCHPDPISRLEWAYSQQYLTSAPQAVLACLAYRDGESCHPSQGTIAKDTKLSVRTVKRCLAYLEDAGYLTRTPRFKGNQRVADDYELAYNGVVEPAYTYSERGGATVTPPALSDTTLGVTVTGGVVSQWPTEQEEEPEEEREEPVTSSPVLSADVQTFGGPGGEGPGALPGGGGGQPGDGGLWVEYDEHIGMSAELATRPEAAMVRKMYKRLALAGGVDKARTHFRSMGIDHQDLEKVWQYLLECAKEYEVPA